MGVSVPIDDLENLHEQCVMGFFNMDEVQTSCHTRFHIALPCVQLAFVFANDCERSVI